MSIGHQVVIDSTTGDALRNGFCDFENDGSFDAENEEIRTDAPIPVKARGGEDETMMSRWNGSEWIEVAQPGP